jgi:DNA-binding transcriptional ArsR family regulator
VPSSPSEVLEGTTFVVYAYVVKEGRPVGTRDVMRGANLSSPSVAYRHLQKLEGLGLLHKNEYGEYVVKEKANIRGFLWVGRSLIPRMLFYCFFFLGILIVEIVILAIHFSVEGYQFKVFFFYMILITAGAMVLFLVEGVLLLLKFRRGRTTSNLT